MKRIFVALLAIVALSAVPAFSQNATVISNCAGVTYNAGQSVPQTQDTTGRNCVNSSLSSQYPQGATALTGNAAGTTGAVVGTLAASSGVTTYICGFNVQAIGGTATVGPITVAGLTGSSQIYQTDVNSATVGKTVASATFNPCIPASSTNTAITVTTTANGTATAVDVNSWGYRF